MKQEITKEQKDFRLDSYTLNNQFTYWLVKAKCIWSLKETNQKYDNLREDVDHATAMEVLKKEMFKVGIKD